MLPTDKTFQNFYLLLIHQTLNFMKQWWKSEDCQVW